MAQQGPRQQIVKVEMEISPELRQSGVTIGGRSMQEIEALLWYSAQCWQSGMLSGAINTPQKAFFMLLKGTSLGLPAEASWDLLYPTQAGRVALTKKGALAVVQSKASYGGYEERIENEGTPEMRAVAIAWRKGQSPDRPTIKEFSLKDAERAGLLKKPRRRQEHGGGEYDGTYQLYLKDMLLSRAGCRVLNVAFAGELAGCLMEGEAEDADDMAASRGDQPAVAATGAATALQGTAQRMMLAPPKRDPLLEELRAAKKAPEDEIPVTLLPDEPRPQNVQTPRGSDVGTPEYDGSFPAVTEAQRAVIDQQVDEVFGAPEKACPRCKAGLNAMGGCDVCGWPSEDDFRGDDRG